MFLLLLNICYLCSATKGLESHPFVGTQEIHYILVLVARNTGGLHRISTQCEVCGFKYPDSSFIYWGSFWSPDWSWIMLYSFWSPGSDAELCYIIVYEVLTNVEGNRNTYYILWGRKGLMPSHLSDPCVSVLSYEEGKYWCVSSWKFLNESLLSNLLW